MTRPHFRPIKWFSSEVGLCHLVWQLNALTDFYVKGKLFLKYAFSWSPGQKQCAAIEQYVHCTCKSFFFLKTRAGARPCHNQGLTYRPVRPNQWSPVPVYRSGLAGNRSEPVKFKFEFKSRRAIGSDRLTGRFDW